MSREWKPGDVAMVPGVGRALVCDSGVARFVSNLGDRDFRDYEGVRPLLVIDPEDDDRVRVIRDAMVTAIVEHTNARDRMLSNEEFDTVISRALQALIAEPEAWLATFSRTAEIVTLDGKVGCNTSMGRLTRLPDEEGTR